MAAMKPWAVLGILALLSGSRGAAALRRAASAAWTAAGTCPSELRVLRRAKVMNDTGRVDPSLVDLGLFLKVVEVERPVKSPMGPSFEPGYRYLVFDREIRGGIIGTMCVVQSKVRCKGSGAAGPCGRRCEQDVRQQDLPYVRSQLGGAAMALASRGRASAPKAAAVIGVGAGSMAAWLLATFPDVQVDAVDNEAVVMRAADECFGFKRDAALDLATGNASGSAAAMASLRGGASRLASANGTGLAAGAGNASASVAFARSTRSGSAAGAAANSSAADSFAEAVKVSRVRLHEHIEDGAAFLRARPARLYDLVFMDVAPMPPQFVGLVPELLQRLGPGGVLAANGWSLDEKWQGFKKKVARAFPAAWVDENLKGNEVLIAVTAGPDGATPALPSKADAAHVSPEEAAWFGERHWSRLH